MDFLDYGDAEALEQIKALAKSPVHAHIFLGPPTFPALQIEGEIPPPPSILRSYMREFAGQVFGKYGEEQRELARQELHPNLRVIEPEGRTFRVEDAKRVSGEVFTSPRNISKEKIIVCDRFHTADESVATRLLKVIEEPPPHCILILLTEAELPQTITSRCLQTTFNPIAPEKIVIYIHELLSQQGIKSDNADADIATAGNATADNATAGIATADIADIAESADGDLGRAHFLARRDSYQLRNRIWGQAASYGGTAPDGASPRMATGAEVDEQVSQIREFLDQTISSLDELAKSEDTIKREKRRIRDTEIKFGFSILAKLYHQQLLAMAQSSDSNSLELEQKRKNIVKLNEAAASLRGNPNEVALLTDLFLSLN